MPLHCTAIGKVFLAHLPIKEREDLITDLEFEQRTPYSITSPGDLRVAVEEVKSKGYAFDDQEFAMGVRCYSAPIMNSTGNVIAAVSLTGLLNYLPLQKEKEIVSNLQETCLKISETLGYRSN
jgi:DNA-binding IclR family transcriptional regulator